MYLYRCAYCPREYILHYAEHGNATGAWCTTCKRCTTFVVVRFVK